MLALLPLLKKTTRRIAIKASPMFDVGEAFRLFGPHCRVDVISIANECKEVVIELSEDINVPMIRATAVGKGAAEYPYTRPKVKSASFAPPYRYMLVPDVALRKARITADWAAANLPAAYATPGDGYVFFNDPPSGLLLGKVFEIIHTWEYSPRSIKKQLKDRGIKSAEIMLHGFPRTAAQICRDLGIREGGDTKLAFTRIEGTLWTLELKELPLH